jgi:hypothetical protein
VEELQRRCCFPKLLLQVLHRHPEQRYQEPKFRLEPVRSFPQQRQRIHHSCYSQRRPLELHRHNYCSRSLEPSSKFEQVRHSNRLNVAPCVGRDAYGHHHHSPSHSKVLVQVHSMVLELVHNMVLVQVHSMFLRQVHSNRWHDAPDVWRKCQHARRRHNEIRRHEPYWLGACQTSLLPQLLQS